MTDITAARINEVLKAQLASFTASVDVRDVGTVIKLGDGIAHVDGLKGAMAGELLEFVGEGGHTVMGMALNLDENEVGAVLPGRDLAHQGERRGPHDRPRRPGPVRQGLPRPRRRPAGPADRRPGRDHRRGHPPARVPRAGRHRAQGGPRAAADRHHGHRLDDPDRPRPARAHHRRPPDGQDRRRGRRDHQPEGHGRHLHLRRDRPEGLHRGRRRRRPSRSTARWTTPSSSSPPPPTRRRCSTSPRWRAAPWASTSCTRARTASPRARTTRAARSWSSTTTSPSRPSPTARCR